MIAQRPGLVKTNFGESLLAHAEALEDAVCHILPHGAAAELAQGGHGPLRLRQHDIRRDLNRGLYQKLGFIPSVIPSLKDRNHKVLFTQLDSLLKNGFNA